MGTSRQDNDRMMAYLHSWETGEEFDRQEAMKKKTNPFLTVLVYCAIGIVVAIAAVLVYCLCGLVAAGLVALAFWLIGFDSGMDFPRLWALSSIAVLLIAWVGMLIRGPRTAEAQ